jgi:ABC-type polysaccharide/polyol phosphate export permease
LPGRHLFLLRELVRRDFRSRYAGSFLGIAWSLIQPLWQLVLFWFVFSTVLGLRQPDARTEHYAIFLFCALVPWLAVQEGVLRSATAITDNAELVKKMRFPPELFVLSAVLGGLMHSGLATIVLVAALVVLGAMSWGTLWILALALPLQLMLAIGLGLLLASVHVFFRDTAQLIHFLLTTWFYLTPIVYPITMVPGDLRTVILANPMTAVAELYRTAFLGHGEVGLPLGGMISLVICAVVLLSAGVWLFRVLRPSFADEI